MPPQPSFKESGGVKMRISHKLEFQWLPKIFQRQEVKSLHSVWRHGIQKNATLQNAMYHNDT